MSKYTKAAREATKAEAKWIANHEHYHRMYQANIPPNGTVYNVASDYMILSGNAKVMLDELARTTVPGVDDVLPKRRSRVTVARNNKVAKRTKKIARRM